MIPQFTPFTTPFSSPDLGVNNSQNYDYGLFLVVAFCIATIIHVLFNNTSFLNWIDKSISDSRVSQQNTTQPQETVSQNPIQPQETVSQKPIQPQETVSQNPIPTPARSFRPELKAKMKQIALALGKTCSLKWLSGSKSPSIPLTQRTKGLVPTGMLLDNYGIAPLCGELRNGIRAENGNNRFSISGAPIMSYGLAIAYSTICTSQKTLEESLATAIEHTLERTEFSNHKRVAMMRVLHLTNNQIKRNVVKTELRRLRTTTLDKKQENDLNQIERMLHEKSMISTLTAAEIDMISNPFPVLYATTNKLEINFSDSWMANELAVQGEIPFGKEGIDMIFTPDENLEKVRTAFAYLPDVTVQSTKALEITQEKNSSFASIVKSNYRYLKRSLTKVCDRISILEASYATCYKNPYVENQRRWKSLKRKFISFAKSIPST
jgi:hypothetical protein